MIFPIIDFKNDDIESFIRQWSSFYSYKKMDLYTHNIDKEILKEADLEQLYEWKNGSVLSIKKSESLKNNILSKVSEINMLKKKFDEGKFESEFGKISFVWQIFLLHIIAPNTYPIYDQHVHRAYLFLRKDNSYREIENTISDKDKKEFYNNIYLKFVQELRQKYNFSIQDLDKALFTLGQFVKKYKVEIPPQ